MRRLQLFRHRTRPSGVEDVPPEEQAPEEIAPFVPSEQADYPPYTPPEAEQTPPATSSRRRLPRFRRPRLPRLSVEIRWDVLGVALALIVSGVLGTLLQRGTLQGQAQTQWPAVLVALGAVWALVALMRRHVTAFLGAAALVGAGLSLIMDTHAIAPARETLFGVVLVAVGLGIVVRGFVLRQRVR